MVYEIVKEVTKIIVKDWGNWLRELYFSSRVLHLRAEKSTGASLRLYVLSEFIFTLEASALLRPTSYYTAARRYFPQRIQSHVQGQQSANGHEIWLVAPGSLGGNNSQMYGLHHCSWILHMIVSPVWW